MIFLYQIWRGAAKLIVGDVNCKRSSFRNIITSHKMKILVIINEAFSAMALGRNTSLAYILSCAKLGHDVYIYNLGNSLPKNRAATIPTLHLSNNKELCALLIKKYEELNEEIMHAVAKNNLEKLHNLKVQRVLEFLPEKTTLKKIKLSEVEFVIQRLEPMKFPFPPHGRKDVNIVLAKLKKLFPKLVFNCPINLSDKEIPQQINRFLKENISTPTSEFTLADKSFSKSIESMAKEYHKLYKKDFAKLVFKPKNSAQSLGVFAVEFSKNGMDLETLKKQKIEELHLTQNHKIKNDLNEKELKKIIEILCYLQNSQKNKELSELTHAQIVNTARKLYHSKILVQPFLEGVKSGDIRTNFLKDKNGDFYTAGHTFRRSLRTEDKNFTTTYSTGGATSQPITILAIDELKNLFLKNAAILEILNGRLKKKYRDVAELGADFILVGDRKNIFLGEINHHCQALIPISEAMGRAVDKKTFYEFGLGLTTWAVKDAIKRQEKVW